MADTPLSSLTPQQQFQTLSPGVDINTPQGQALFQQWLTSNGGANVAGSTPTSTAAPASAPGTGLDLGSLASPNAALNAAISGAQTGGNTDQVQGAQQQGAFTSTGQTNTAGTQQETGQQSGQTQQQQNTTGQQTTTGQQQTTGNAATTGLSQPVDTLGLGSLLASQAPAAAGATGASQDFLQSVLAPNNALLQAQTSNAVNQSLSGPGMVGAGDGARARAAGDAAAQVGLQSQGQQINAASALGGPTATTTLANAGSPFVGTQTSGNQSTSGLSDTTGSTLSAQDLSSLTNSLNLSSLLNQSNTSTNEAQSGSSGASSTQEAIGQVPNSQTSSGSGCYVCTAYVQIKRLHRAPIVRGAVYKLSHPRYARSLAGYSVYGPTLARWVLRSRCFANFFFPIAKAVLYEECRRAHGRMRKQLVPTLCHAVFHYGSIPFAFLWGRKKMCGEREDTLALLRRNNLIWRVS